MAKDTKGRRLPLADALIGVAGLAVGLFFGLWRGGAFDPRPELASLTLNAPGMKEAARADELAGEGKLAEAVRVLEGAEETDGCRAALLLLRARGSVESDPGKALSALGEFITDYQGSWRRWEAMLLAVRALLALGQRKDAEETLKTALLFEPRRRERGDRPIGRRGAWPGCTHAAWLTLAQLTYEDGAYSDAKDAAELVPEERGGEVFARSPQRPAALLLWARALSAQGAEKTARAGLMEIVDLFPESPEAAEARELLER